MRPAFSWTRAIRVFGGFGACVCTLFFFSERVAHAQVPILGGDAPAYERASDEFAAALVVDVSTGKELYAWQADKRWPAASLTKLLSALVVLDRAPRWDRIVSLTRQDEVGGGRLRVAPGARIRVRDLLYASIVGSANNAAMALARTSGLRLKTFVARMNAKAKALGMRQSHFVDPVGMDPNNISSARDLAKLATAAFAKPVIQRAASTPVYTFRIRNRKQKKTIHNTNRLLTEAQELTIIGGKTGYLEEAKRNFLVELAGASNPAKPQLLIVVLGSPDPNRMFLTAKGLAEWAWQAYDWPSVRTTMSRP